MSNMLFVKANSEIKSSQDTRLSNKFVLWLQVKANVCTKFNFAFWFC